MERMVEDGQEDGQEHSKEDDGKEGIPNVVPF